MASLRHGLAVALVMLAGCGGDEGAEGGSGTLRVIAEVSYSPLERQQDGLLQPADVSWARVEVAREGVAVRGAEVTFEDVASGERFAVAAGAEEGYQAALPGYHRDLRLAVRAGDDWLMSRLRGPPRHTVAEPVAGGVAARRRGMTLRWRAAERGGCSASCCALTRSGWAAESARDSRACAIPADELLAGPEIAVVSRRAERQPSGAAEGSRLTMVYSLAIPFLVQD